LVERFADRSKIIHADKQDIRACRLWRAARRRAAQDRRGAEAGDDRSALKARCHSIFSAGCWGLTNPEN